MKAPRIVITGRPGSGKSTLFNNILNYLRNKGYRIAGVHSPEVRDEKGRRIGFKFIDLYDGYQGWLARRNYHSSIRVGAYGVVVDEALRVWKRALENMEKADVIGIDEVGPMELKLPQFKTDLTKIINAVEKPLILVIHYRLRDPEILNALNNALKYVVTIDNRAALSYRVPKEVADIIDRFYKRE